PMVFLSSGQSHHDIALVGCGSSGVTSGNSLHHFAAKVGDSVDDLAQVKEALEAECVPIHIALDHRVSQGLYITDPDGNLIELYVDAHPEHWRDDPSLVAHSDPLSL